ncbi:RTC4-like domain-containing protein [Mycena polygramma]|nr:RTC4-like domain-containing protein [Mycena polygramma]
MDDDLEERLTKKSRFANEDDVILAKDYKFQSEESTSFISPDVDPKTLCPYCDRPMPLAPTAVLERLLSVMFSKSIPDPRPANPLGRKARSEGFATLCQRHAFERDMMPRAIAQGWPTVVNWDGLKARVEALTSDLDEILKDTGSKIVYGNTGEQDDIQTRPNGPRMECVFWTELLAALKASGSRGVSSVSGQFSSFEKTQPGYYGELGTVIITQSLYKSFPPETVDAELVSPLTLREFIGCVLVPEVGMRLIMEDLDLDKDEAVAVLRASASYGVSMFPDDGGASGMEDTEDFDFQSGSDGGSVTVWDWTAGV